MTQEVIVSDGHVIDPNSGLVVPSAMVKSGGANYEDTPDILRGLIDRKNFYDSGLAAGGFNYGVRFKRDPDTLVVCWPRKGSGIDDRVMAAIADGEVANVGVTPCPFPQIPGIIKRQQAQAQTATIDLQGKETPVRRAKSALSRFDDSPLGASQALCDLVYNLRVYNRGSPIALAPIHYDMNVWGEHGMTAVPILREGQPEDTADMFYLEIDFRQVDPVPFIPNPLDFVPTGIGHPWPYWYRARMGNKHKWVLLHSSQVVSLTPGKSSRPMIGTSSLWICLGFAAEEILVIEERTEKKLSNLTNGILGISGVSQDSATIRKELEAQDELLKEQGRFFGSEYTILTSPNNRVTFTMLSLRQNDGVDFDKRRQFHEDVMALAFDEPLAAIVTRGGVGFGVSAPETARQTADTGVNSILSAVELAIGAIYSRVVVTIARPNDQAQRLNIETFNEFSSGIRDLNTGQPEDSEPVLTRAEIRSIIERDIFSIPSTDEDEVRTGATANDDSEIDEIDDEDSEDEQVDEESLRLLVEAFSIDQAAQAINDLRYFDPVEPDGADEDIPAGQPDVDQVSPDQFNEEFPEVDGLLEAELSELEEPPAAEPEAPIDSWLWLATPIIFHRRRDADQVDRDRALGYRDSLADLRGSQTTGLARDLASGDLTLRQWVESMRDITEVTYMHEYQIGRGGRSSMTNDDITWLNERVDGRFRDIDDLADRIRNAEFSEAQIANFSGNIVRSSVMAYERANGLAFGANVDGMGVFPGDSNRPCRGACKCFLTHERIFNDNGELVRIETFWNLSIGAQHCTGCLRDNERFSPFITQVL